MRGAEAGGAGAARVSEPCIAPVPEGKLSCEDPPAASPPDPEAESGCQEAGMASCGAAYPGDSVPGLLLAAETAGIAPEAGDIEREVGVKDAVAEDGATPTPI